MVTVSSFKLKRDSLTLILIAVNVSLVTYNRLCNLSYLCIYLCHSVFMSLGSQSTPELRFNQEFLDPLKLIFFVLSSEEGVYISHLDFVFLYSPPQHTTCTSTDEVLLNHSPALSAL